MGKKSKAIPSASSSTDPKPVRPEPEAPGVLERHGLAVNEYARKVVKGDIIACRWVRLACKRHLDDLKRSRFRKCRWKFDLKKAGAICYFIELLPHIDGDWGSPTIELELWQKFWLGSIYGWVDRKTGLRRFTKAYISVPRKNAKTTALAGVGLFGLTCDGEPGAQVYNGANKLEQAMLLFEPARLMVEARKDLFKRLGVEIRGAKALFVRKTNARWRPVSRKPGDGGGAHLFIQDEFHEALTSLLTDAMVQGQGARKQPLAVFITTAGTNLAGPCYSYEQQIKQILEGVFERERTFGIIYTIDEQPYTDPFGKEQPADDWTTVTAAIKANPNWGVSVIEDTFLTELEEAIQDPSKQAIFKTKRLNIWTNAAHGYLNLTRWTECYDQQLRLEEFHGQECLLGADFANKIDLVPTCKLFRREDPEFPGEEEKAHYFAFWRWYLPSAVADLPANTHYAEWKARGYLTVTDGEITDYRFVLRQMIEDTQRFKVMELAFDQREAALITQDFQESTGIEIFEVPQTVIVLSEPLKWLKALIQDRRLHHCNDPLATWCVSNLEAKPDQNENVFPRHPQGDQKRKIDGVSALLNCLVRAREVLNVPPPVPFKVEVWS